MLKKTLTIQTLVSPGTIKGLIRDHLIKTTGEQFDDEEIRFLYTDPQKIQAECLKKRAV